MTRRLEIWWVGAPARDEWAEQNHWLRSHADVRAFASVRDVCETLRTASAELLVVAQGRPGEIAPGDIETLRRLAPLLPIVQLAGSWCEGELRSGCPWRAAERIYGHQALPQWRADLARHAQGLTPDWMLPLTTTEDERLLARLALTSGPPTSPMPRNGQLVIAAGSYAMQQWLADGALARGLHPILQKDLEHAMPAPSIVAGLWDGNSLAAQADQPARTSLADFARQLAPVPVVALLSFPRIDDLEEARNAGVRQVLSKPCLIDDLFSCL